MQVPGVHARHEVKKKTRVWMGIPGKRLAKWKAGHFGNPLANIAEASGSGNPLADDAEASSNGKGPAGDDNIVVLSDDIKDYA